MLGYLILALLAAALGFVLFSPRLKGFRTQIFGYLTVAVGSLTASSQQIMAGALASDANDRLSHALNESDAVAPAVSPPSAITPPQTARRATANKY